MTIDEIKKALKEVWCRETCYPPIKDQWSKSNKSFGQCAVTVLVVQYYFGGSILNCEHNHHYWNKLLDGTEIDLTRDQFKKGEKICEDSMGTRKHLLESDGAIKADTKKRYILLKKLVENVNKK